jgi:WD40 repeat protein
LTIGASLRPAFSPDGQRLASAVRDNTVKVWDAATGREIVGLKGDSQSVRAVVCSPDGKRLAGPAIDQTVKIWDAATGEEILSRHFSLNITKNFGARQAIGAGCAGPHTNPKR